MTEKNESTNGQTDGENAEEMALTVQETSNFDVVYHDPENLLLDTAGFRQAKQAATMFAHSDFVPNTKARPFKGKVANCMVAFTMANALDVHPFFLMRNLYQVYGQPATEAKFMIGLLNRSRYIEGRIEYEHNGKTGAERGWIAKAVDAETRKTFTVEITEQIARDNGWFTKNDSHWPKNFDLMARYRAAAWLINLYYPDVVMGLETVEELRDVGGASGPTLIESEVTDAQENVPEQLKPANAAPIVETVEFDDEPEPDPEPPKSTKRTKKEPEPKEAVKADPEPEPEPEPEKPPAETHAPRTGPKEGRESGKTKAERFIIKYTAPPVNTTPTRQIRESGDNWRRSVKAIEKELEEIDRLNDEDMERVLNEPDSPEPDRGQTGDPGHEHDPEKDEDLAIPGAVMCTECGRVINPGEWRGFNPTESPICRRCDPELPDHSEKQRNPSGTPKNTPSEQLGMDQVAPKTRPSKVHVRALNDIKKDPKFKAAINQALESGDIQFDWLKTTGEDMARTVISRIGKYFAGDMPKVESGEDEQPATD